MIENEISHQIDDARGSIGKRYCRADEIGTKYAITLDYRTLEDSRTVTLRERDSTKQIRVKVNYFISFFYIYIFYRIKFLKR